MAPRISSACHATPTRDARLPRTAGAVRPLRDAVSLSAAVALRCCDGDEHLHAKQLQEHNKSQILRMQEAKDYVMKQVEAKLLEVDKRLDENDVKDQK